MRTCIQINENQYSVIAKKDMPEGERTRGVGGFGEDGKLYSLYVYGEKIYFQIENDFWEIEPLDFLCSNVYIENGIRLFTLRTKGEDICKVKYKPFIDPGMIYYDADEEEFDVLLYLSRLLKSEETIENFRIARSS